jgi:hypothetical protein
MVKPTASSRLLAAVSVAQLATGVAGMVVALRRRYPYHVFWMRGRADAIARDTIFMGTALSAPVSNLLLQAAVTCGWPGRGDGRARRPGWPHVPARPAARSRYEWLESPAFGA